MSFWVCVVGTFLAGWTVGVWVGVAFAGLLRVHENGGRQRPMERAHPCGCGFHHPGACEDRGRPLAARPPQTTFRKWW
mgnify:CR=1 FL=1